MLKKSLRLNKNETLNIYNVRTCNPHAHQVENAFKSEESRKSENLSLKDATHVGCGWIQFPIEKSSSGFERNRFENFLVCNFGFGTKADTSCKTPNVEEKIITYYRFNFRDVSKF